MRGGATVLTGVAVAGGGAIKPLSFSSDVPERAKIWQLQRLQFMQHRPDFVSVNRAVVPPQSGHPPTPIVFSGVATVYSAAAAAGAAAGVRKCAAMTLASCAVSCRGSAA